MSATAGSDGDTGGPGGGAKATSPASADQKPGNAGKHSAGSHGSNGSHDSDRAKADEADEADEGKTTAPTANGTPATSLGGDVFKVGTDIAPGAYKSTGNTDDSCYWERTKDAGQGTDSITANNNVTGTTVVTISPSDAYFKSNACGNWKKA
ncbi:hypothetical protein QWJ26_09695 [Streptomyces sp. CSDS2]|uniref:hypothetical protein n=1 Tax=Streptomyces sp. CSDS2 TaxID=3055051 RepID=UPI0025B21C72|nr:hypothetical protein [Streptomyces sp. CSDS2]MDN3260073.1 hypothetical protein [Streptomyces sp. CSDS2]